MKILLQIYAILLIVIYAPLNAAPDKSEWPALAKKGDTRAMISLGVMYHNGEGVKVDYVKAMDWYLQAYAKKDGDALNNIGVLYRDGLGVPKNEKIAYLLFLRVHMEGLGTDDTQIRAGRNISRLISSLKKEDIYEALSYTWNYVDQIVKSRGKELKIGNDVLPTKTRPRIRDNNWWLDIERKEMNFKSPVPWDKILSDEEVAPKSPTSPTPKEKSEDKLVIPTK